MENNKMKPILFSTEMVQAILAGRKTMTRRIVKPQPSMISGEFDSWIDKTGTIFCPSVESMSKYCPYGRNGMYGRIGNILCVKETFGTSGNRIFYKADNNSFVNAGLKGMYNFKWKPSIFMPREAARIFLVIKNIRVERLHDITDKDAIAEGIEKTEFGYKNYNNTYPVKEFMGGGNEALLSFQSLWVGINGKDSWYENPWVWVIEFERIEFEHQITIEL